jgi:hypothetical protein
LVGLQTLDLAILVRVQASQPIVSNPDANPRKNSLERGGWVYPTSLWGEEPGNDRKRKEIGRIPRGNATALQRECNESSNGKTTDVDAMKQRSNEITSRTKQDPTPLFIVSVASKGLSLTVSLLE